MTLIASLTSACRRRRTASAALQLPAASDAWRSASSFFANPVLQEACRERTVSRMMSHGVMNGVMSHKGEIVVGAFRIPT